MESVTVKNSVIETEESENEENLKKLVGEVLQICTAESINYPPECYEFLERCIRVKDYNAKKAGKLVRSLANAIKGFKYLFSKHDIENCAALHTNGVLTVLKSHDEYGHNVLLLRMGKWHPKEIDCDQVCTTLMLLFLWVVGESKHVQRKGIVAILDLSSFGVQQIRSVSIKTTTKMVHLMNDSAPGKIKAIHFIYHPNIFGPLFSLVKPFIKEKLSKRIHFHKESTTSLQQHFQPEILPESLGGKLGEVEAVDEELVGRFIADQSYASEMDRLGFPKK